MKEDPFIAAIDALNKIRPESSFEDLVLSVWRGIDELVKLYAADSGLSNWDIELAKNALDLAIEAAMIQKPPTGGSAADPKKRAR